jgi:hypothetical protein
MASPGLCDNAVLPVENVRFNLLKRGENDYRERDFLPGQKMEITLENRRFFPPAKK